MIFARIAVLAMMMLSSLTPARADDSTRDEASGYPTRNGGFVAREYAFALEHFESAYRLYRSPNLRFNIAIALMKLHRSAEAATVFEEFLDTSPEASTDAHAYAKAQLDAARLLVGTVTVVSNAVGAKVSIDNQMVGTTPLPHSLYVTAGEHDLQVTDGDKEPFNKRLSAVAGSTVIIEANLVVLATPSVVEQSRGHIDIVAA